MAMKVVYATANGSVLSETRNGSRRLYSLDPLGNTRALYDNTQTKTDTFTYFPSGTVASRTGTTPTPFQWNGGSGYYQNSSNRVYVRARNFYVNLGRWSTQDPLGFKAGDYNLYRYVNNRFVAMIDPSGLVKLVVTQADQWLGGPTPVTGVGYSSPACCGSYRAKWKFTLSKPVKCKDDQGRDAQDEGGYFVQRITFPQNSVKFCSADKKSVPFNCPGYLELVHVSLDDQGNALDTPVDKFQMTSNLLTKSATSGTFQQSGELKFFCAYSINKTGFQRNKYRQGKLVNTGPCAGWSIDWAYLPINSDADLPDWWKKASDDGASDTHSVTATWDCCGIGDGTHSAGSTSDVSITPSPDKIATQPCLFT